MKCLSEEKVDLLFSLLEQGKSIREMAKIAGVAKETAQRYRKEYYRLPKTLDIKLKDGPMGELVNIAGEKLRSRFPQLLEPDKMVDGYHVKVAVAELLFWQRVDGFVEVSYEVTEPGKAPASES